MTLIEKYGLRTPKQKLAETIKEAIDFAESNGYPVVMKILSPDILHKTEHDLIKTNIQNKDQLIKNYKDIISKSKKISENIDGILVQDQVEGIECFIGTKQDSTFGPIIAFGLGGIFVEVFKDVSFRACPITKEDAREMIEEIKGYKILSGFRGIKADIKSLEDMLLKVSKIATKEKIKEMDINPVMVNENTAYAADIKIVH